jgi:hypothetical protein
VLLSVVLVLEAPVCTGTNLSPNFYLIDLTRGGVACCHDDLFLFYVSLQLSDNKGPVVVSFL